MVGSRKVVIPGPPTHLARAHQFGKKRHGHDHVGLLEHLGLFDLLLADQVVHTRLARGETLYVHRFEVKKPCVLLPDAVLIPMQRHFVRKSAPGLHGLISKTEPGGQMRRPDEVPIP